MNYVIKKEKQLREEVFGPSTVIVKCKSFAESLQIAKQIGKEKYIVHVEEGQLTGSLHGTENDFKDLNSMELLHLLKNKVGRVIFNGFPTGKFHFALMVLGVEVTTSMTHGGPFPASTDSRTTSVGTEAIKRFLRPVSFQVSHTRIYTNVLECATGFTSCRTSK